MTTVKESTSAAYAALGYSYRTVRFGVVGSLREDVILIGERLYFGQGVQGSAEFVVQGSAQLSYVEIADIMPLAVSLPSVQLVLGELTWLEEWLIGTIDREAEWKALEILYGRPYQEFKWIPGEGRHWAKELAGSLEIARRIQNGGMAGHYLTAQCIRRSLPRRLFHAC